MQNQATSNDSLINKLLVIFLLVHLVGWTLAPALIRHNLPLDAIEGTIWGNQLEWGYDKNPFMNAWLTALATYLGGQSDWVVYFFSQLSVVTCLYTVWILAKRMLSPAYALLSVLLLEGLQYYNFHAIDFNDNTLELGIWGLTTYFFYRATSCDRITPTHWWLLTGIFAALGMMTKYYTLVLIGGMGLFVLIEPQARRTLATSAPWLGLLAFIAVMLPHAIWLTSNDYITIRYVFERGHGEAIHKNHIFFPAQFAWQQFEVFLPGIILLGLFLIGKRPALSNQRLRLSSFNRTFLFYVGLGPFLLTLLVSAILNVKLRAAWGMPLQSLWAIMLVAWVQPYITRTRLIRATVITLTLIGVFYVAYAISLFYSKDTSTANYPGRDIATQLTNEWHARYHTPLKYLAGSRWAGGNVTRYSPDHPAVLIAWSTRNAPWVNMTEMKKHGAIFIWDIERNETLPETIRNLFPRLEKPQTLTYNWKHNHHNLPHGKVGYAFLPPEHTSIDHRAEL